MTLSRLRIETLEGREAPSVTPAGAEFRANVVTTSAQSAPAVASDDNGDFVVVWESRQDGSGYGIYARRYNSAGTSQTSEFLVNSVTTGEQRFPSVAMDSNGDFVIAFESYGQDGAGYGVYARQFDAAGLALAPAFLVNTTTANDQLRASVAVDATGDFVVAWQSYAQDGAGDGVYFQRYNSSGVAQGNETLANVTTTQFQNSPAVAMDSDGDFVIAWQSYTTDGNGYGVYARRFNAAGSPLATEFRANQNTAGQQQRPTVSVDPNGAFVIAWESDGQDGSAFGIYGRRYNAAGVAIANEFRLNTFTTGDQRTPRLCVDADGDFVALWSSVGQEASDFGIYGQRFTAAGAQDSPEFHVNTYTTGNQTSPAIGNGSNGDFISVWQSESQDGSTFGVYAQRFTVAVPVIPAKVLTISINNAAIQRSSVTESTIKFSQAVFLPVNPADAFTLDGPIGTIQITATITSPSPQTTVKLTFSGAGTTAGSLNDGNYTLTAIAAQIGYGGLPLDGNGDGLSGDNFSYSLYRFYGDVNGDRAVDASEFIVFRLAFGTDNTATGFLSYLDFDGDGAISVSDFIQFRLRFGGSI